MLLKRSAEKELLDDFSIKDERIDASLEELILINRFLGGVSVSKEGLGKFTGSDGLNSSLKILDAGSGSSDILLKIKEKYNHLNIFSLDKNRRACNFSKADNTLKVVCGDIFNLPFKAECLDLAHASLLLHHFRSEELKEILGNLLGIVKRGMIINELRRNILALAGIKILTVLFSKSDLVKNDAPLSVRKGFNKKEIKEIIKTLPAAAYYVKRKWAFRWLIVVYK